MRAFTGRHAGAALEPLLIRITYVSRARSKLPRDLKDILAVTRPNNTRLRVTGALCFLDGAYLQLLEGDRHAVQALYQTIRDDPRHTDAKVLTHTNIVERAFPNWSMALLTWNEETRDIFLRHNPGSDVDLYAADPATVERMFVEMGRSANWQAVRPPSEAW